MTQAVAAPRRRHQLNRPVIERAAPRGEAVPGAARERLLDAMRDLAADGGPHGVEAAALCVRAGVPLTTFAGLFADADDLFAAVVERELDRFADAVVAAAEPRDDWASSAAAAVRAFFATLDRDPRTAWLCVVEGARAEPRVRAARAAASDRIGVLLRPPDHDTVAPPGAVPMLVGGLWELAYQQLAGAGEAASLTDLAGPATFLVLAPHVGPAAARAHADGRL